MCLHEDHVYKTPALYSNTADIQMLVPIPIAFTAYKFSCKELVHDQEHDAFSFRYRLKPKVHMVFLLLG